MTIEPERFIAVCMILVLVSFFMGWGIGRLSLVEEWKKNKHG